MKKVVNMVCTVRRLSLCTLLAVSLVVPVAASSAPAATTPARQFITPTTPTRMPVPLPGQTPVQYMTSDAFMTAFNTEFLRIINLYRENNDMAPLAFRASVAYQAAEVARTSLNAATGHMGPVEYELAPGTAVPYATFYIMQRGALPIIPDPIVEAAQAAEMFISWVANFSPDGMDLFMTSYHNVAGVGFVPRVANCGLIVSSAVVIISGDSTRGAYGDFLRSNIHLPNRRLTNAERQEWIDDYNAMGGITPFELEIVRLVNAVRVEHNLSRVTVDTTLMHASRFYSQQLSNLNLPLGHDQGPYGGSRAVADAFGANMRWSGGNAHRGESVAANVVARWMASEGHRAYLLSPEHRYIGVGSVLSQQGAVISYMLLSNRASN